jgi:predicted DNA-binding transcriptional regulator YafY
MLASQLKKTVDKISELMEVSDRTIFRYRDLIKNEPIK